MMKRARVAIMLEVEVEEENHEDVLNLVEALLDAGVPQDAINDHGLEEPGRFHVKIAVARVVPPTLWRKLLGTIPAAVVKNAKKKKKVTTPTPQVPALPGMTPLDYVSKAQDVRRQQAHAAAHAPCLACAREECAASGSPGIDREQPGHTCTPPAPTDPADWTEGPRREMVAEINADPNERAALEAKHSRPPSDAGQEEA